MHKYFVGLGKDVITWFEEFLNFCAFLYLTVKELTFFWSKRSVSLSVLIRQVFFTGVESLRLINFIGLALGAIIIIQGMSLLQNFGQSKFVYNILIIIVTKELGPLLTAFIIISRSGTAIATELGNMVVNHEVEALKSIGINPITYLVVPRILGVLISIFSLTLYFNISGLLGGYFVSTIIYPLPFFEFFSELLKRMTVTDILLSQFKSLTFGFIIAIISCYQGLKVSYASTEVPQRTIKAVVQSLSWMIIFNIILTSISYSL